MNSPSNRLDAVEALLRSRADRGVFRSFAAARVRGRLDCSLVWLKEHPTRILFDPRLSRLEFRGLLPGFGSDRVAMRDLRHFLRERAGERMPAHRRVDPQRIALRSTSRQGDVSVSLDSLDGDLEHLVAKGLKLVNEIFFGFLKGPYHAYMVEHFQEPED